MRFFAGGASDAVLLLVVLMRVLVLPLVLVFFFAFPLVGGGDNPSLSDLMYALALSALRPPVYGADPLPPSPFGGMLLLLLLPTPPLAASADSATKRSGAWRIRLDVRVGVAASVLARFEALCMQNRTIQGERASERAR